MLIQMLILYLIINLIHNHRMKEVLLILIVCIITFVPPYFLARWVVKKRKKYHNDAISMGVLAFIFGALVMFVIEVVVAMSQIHC